LGIIFSAVYLLWSYQRVFFGEVTQDRNRTLPDASVRERSILFVMAAVILWMGIGSTAFTRRMEISTANVLQLMERPTPTYDSGVRPAAPAAIHGAQMNSNQTPPAPFTGAPVRQAVRRAGD